MAYRGCTATSHLQHALAEAVDRLAALAKIVVARKTFIDEDDPDDLKRLAALTLDIARALDPIFHEIACQGGVGSRSRACAHATYVSSAIEGNLDFELRDRAERIMAACSMAHPDSEHSLTAADLGVGGHRQ